MTSILNNVRRTDADGAVPPKGASVVESVTRYDFAELAPARWTDEGYLRFEGFVVKPGVMVYQGDNGPTRVLIPPETIHSKAAIDTLRLKPLTLGHPDPVSYPDQVTPENERLLSVGTTGENVSVKADGRVAFSCVLRDAAALHAVADMRQDGRTLGLSPGYKCQEEITSGTHPVYGEYDRIQRNRRYNHLAITDSPRGGSSVHFRVDESDTEIPMSSALIQALILLGLSRSDAEAAAQTPEKAAAVVEAAGKARVDAEDKARQDAEDRAREANSEEAREAAREVRILSRKTRTALDVLAAEYKIDAVQFDDDVLKAQILKAAKVSIPRVDGMDEANVIKVTFQVFQDTHTSRSDAQGGAPSSRDAFRFDGDAQEALAFDAATVYTTPSR